MKDYIIEICDRGSARKDFIVFREEERLETERETGRGPGTFNFVRKMKEKARQKGYVILADRAQLHEIARRMLVEGERVFSVAGESAGTRIHDGSELSLEMQGRLAVVRYGNHVEDMEALADAVRREGNVPVVWNSASGFVVGRSSERLPLLEDIDGSVLRDPRDALRFVLRKPRARVVYIFEDFHHFIGDRDAVHPNVGEVRSLIKELYRSLRGRDERVVFFVPSSFEFPSELQPFLAWEPETGKTEGRLLERFGERLDDAEYLLKSKVVVGVDDLIERVMQILAQMEANNPLLVGHPGVGKTSVVEGLARAMHEGRVPQTLKGRELYSVSLNSLVAGTRYRGDFEGRLDGLMREVMESRGRTIVFVDEVHTLLDAGSAEGAVGAGEALKGALARGSFPCIGATTFVGAESLARDPALSRRFKKVVVRERTPEEAVRILMGVRSSFERHHNVRIEDEALEAAVRLSTKHLREGYLPGKAISLLDGAAAYCRIMGLGMLREADIWREVKRLV